MGDVSWFNRGFPRLAKLGYAPKFQALAAHWPPRSTNVQKWRSAQVLQLLEILGLQSLEGCLREQEFLPEGDTEESPFGSLDAPEVDEIFSGSGADAGEVEALKVSLRYLKGEFFDVSVMA
ncbi:unnamed protein product [Phaeothamnion confervicola]